MRARVTIIGLIGAVALGVLAAVPAGAGKNVAGAPLMIEKVVDGSAPEGTQFFVAVTCEDPEISPGGTTTAQVVFDAQGTPLSPNTVLFEGETTCVVTETQTGGAATVSYECEGSVPPVDNVQASGRFAARGLQLLPCQTSGPQAEPIGVNIADELQTATVTITNTFVDPGAPAAAPVPGTPRFTG